MQWEDLGSKSVEKNPGGPAKLFFSYGRDRFSLRKEQTRDKTQVFC